MRNVILLIAVCLFSSCGAVHKLQEKHREHKRVKSERKSESEANRSMDSTGTTETTATGSSTTTVTVDTTIHVDGDTLTGIAIVPDTGESVTFSDGNVTTEVGIGANGKMRVKTTTRAKNIPVKQTTTQVSSNTQTARTTSSVKTDEKMSIKTYEITDSTVSRSAVSKQKEVKRGYGGLLICCLLLVIIIAAVLLRKYL